MNAATEIDRLLEQSGAVLIRHKKHLVYRLPNGSNFVASKTPGDPLHASENKLHALRRALGATATTTPPKEKAMPVGPNHQDSQPTQPPPAPALLATIPATPPTPVLAPAVGVTASGGFRARIETQIGAEEATRERLMAEAEQCDRRVQMLKALLPFAEDPNMELALLGALQVAPVPAHRTYHPRQKGAAAPARPKAPDRITDRVQVTRELVLAATQTFDQQFTVNDVVGLMTNGATIDPPERLRIRSSIAACLNALDERGEVQKGKSGIGRVQTLWRKVRVGPGSPGSRK